MSYFNTNFIAFFESLSKNNNNTWFAEHRKTYENEVRKPFEEFAEELLTRVALEIPEMSVPLFDALYRIKKEDRIGFNKLPYRECMALCIGKHGRFDRTVPHIYIECSAEGVMMSVGVQVFDNQSVENFRKSLVDDFKTLKYIQSRPLFTEKFGRIHADRYQTLPDAWKTFSGAVPWLHSKNMYIEKRFSKEILLAHDVTDILMEHFYIALDFFHFLKNAMSKQKALANLS